MPGYPRAERLNSSLGQKYDEFSRSSTGVDNESIPDREGGTGCSHDTWRGVAAGACQD